MEGCKNKRTKTVLYDDCFVQKFFSVLRHVLLNYLNEKLIWFSFRHTQHMISLDNVPCDFTRKIIRYKNASSENYFFLLFVKYFITGNVNKTVENGKFGENFFGKQSNFFSLLKVFLVFTVSPNKYKRENKNQKNMFYLLFTSFTERKKNLFPQEE